MNDAKCTGVSIKVYYYSSSDIVKYNGSLIIVIKALIHKLIGISWVGGKYATQQLN